MDYHEEVEAEKEAEIYKTLDNDWINEFEKIDKDYELFYNEDLQFLKIHSIYINTNNIIEKIIQEKIILNNSSNLISRDKLLGILKNNAFNYGKRYSILSILKYNIHLQSSEIKDYIKTNNNDSFLSIIKNIDDIFYEKTINMFQDLNDLILLFYEKSPEEQNSIGLQRTKTSSGSMTKKVYINRNYGVKNKHTNTYRKPI
jgi:hypothetical protein